MVRRAVAMKIGELANCVEKDHVINDLIPLFRQLTTDDQDQIRSLCLESLK
jgi:serine/threonine-protein phosphatase 2A regulatory subunit A